MGNWRESIDSYDDKEPFGKRRKAGQPESEGHQRKQGSDASSREQSSLLPVLVHLGVGTMGHRRRQRADAPVQFARRGTRRASFLLRGALKRLRIPDAASPFLL